MAGGQGARGRGSGDGGDGPNFGGRPSSKRRSSCMLCGESVKSMSLHVRRRHLPWFWVPEFACWACAEGFGDERQRNRHFRDWCPRPDGAAYKAADESMWLRLMAEAQRVMLGALGIDSAYRAFCWLEWMAYLPAPMEEYCEGSGPWTWRRAIGGNEAPSLQFRGVRTEAEALLSWRVAYGLLRGIPEEHRRQVVEVGRRVTNREVVAPLPSVTDARAYLRALSGVTEHGADARRVERR